MIGRKRKREGVVAPFSTTFTFSSIRSSSEPIDFIPSFRVLFPHIDVFVEQPERFTGKLHARHDSQNIQKSSIVTV